MAQIPTYERNPQAQQLGGTSKLSVSGSPVAQAVGQLGGQIKDIGAQFVQKQQQLQDLGASSDYIVTEKKAFADAYALWDQAMLAPDNTLRIEDKPQFVREEVEQTLGQYVQDIEASDLQKQRIQNRYQQSFAELEVGLQKEVALRQAERYKVQTENAVNEHIMSAQDSLVTGDTEAFDSHMSKAQNLLTRLEEAGAATPQQVDGIMKQGWYSATARILASSQSTPMVDEAIDMIQNSKEKYTPGQYQEVLRIAETQKRNIKASWLNTMSSALKDKNATPEQLIDLAQRAEDEAGITGMVDLVKQTIMQDFSAMRVSEKEADEEIVTGVREAVATTPQDAQDAVENYINAKRDNLWEKAPTAEEIQADFSNVIETVLNANIPDIRVKQLMLLDVLEACESKMAVDAKRGLSQWEATAVTKKRQHIKKFVQFTILL